MPLEPTPLSRYAAAELIEQAEARFVVASVTGVFIDPAVGAGKHGDRPLPTSYYVQDRAYCYCVVAAFESPRNAVVGKRSSDVERLRLAQARCDELNRWDREGALSRSVAYPETPAKSQDEGMGL